MFGEHRYNEGVKLPLHFAALGVCVLASTGCYNNPAISSRNPQTTDIPMHKGPSVGPGKAAGGSTAGPATPGAQAHGEEKPAGEHAKQSEAAPADQHGSASAPEHK